MASCAALLGAAALLAPAPGAGATTHSPPPVGGPVLTPDGAAWVAPFGGSAWLWNAPANGPASRRQPIPGDVGFEMVDAPMAASPSRLAMMTDLARPGGVRFGGGDPEREVFGGALDGQLTTLEPRCKAAAGLPPSIDASGDLIAYEMCNSTGDAAVVDPDTGAVQTIPGAGYGVRIAGRYMAWLENYDANHQLLFGHPYDVVVYDRVAGTVVYRIPASATDGGVHSFDIQDDGKLALSYVTLSKARESVMRVAWASIASPTLHRLRLPASGTYEIALVHDTIGFERGQGETLDFGEIGASDLAGHTHLVARNAQGLVGHRTFDFDGRRLAWWSYGCSAARINVVRKNARTVPRERRGCPLTFRVPPRLVNAHALTFRVNCFGFAFCRVRRVTLAVRRPHGAVVARGHGRRARLTRAGAALLKTRGKLRVRMTATITDLVLRKEQRRAVVTIRLP